MRISALLHARRVGSAQVVVAAQVQDAVHDEVRVVRAQRLALFARFAAR